MILGEDRYVCQVGISNIGDLLLGPADSSYGLSYFGFLYPSTKKVESTRIRVCILIVLEVILWQRLRRGRF